MLQFQLQDSWESLLLQKTCPAKTKNLLSVGQLIPNRPLKKKWHLLYNERVSRKLRECKYISGTNLEDADAVLKVALQLPDPRNLW